MQVCRYFVGRFLIFILPFTISAAGAFRRAVTFSSAIITFVSIISLSLLLSFSFFFLFSFVLIIRTVRRDMTFLLTCIANQILHIFLGFIIGVFTIRFFVLLT